MVLRARYLLEQRTEGAIRGAIAQFERAIELEPRYAMAHVALAEAFSLLPVYSDIPAAQGMTRASQAALEAIRLDDSLAEAHAILGLILTEYEWEWPRAEREYRRALELNPNSAYSHKLYAEYLTYMGRFDEATAAAQLAIQLDPASPVADAVLGIVYYNARQYEKAIAQLRGTVDKFPFHPLAHMLLGLAYGQQGLHEEAIAALEKSVALSGSNSEYLAQLGGAQARAGHTQQARDILRELAARSRTQYIAPFLHAVAHAGLGEHGLALDWLERGYDDRSWLMCVLNVEPIFDPLRGEARFQQLLGRMNFPASSRRTAVQLRQDH